MDDRRDSREQRLWALVEASVAASSELGLDAVLQRICVVASDVVGAHYGALGVLNEERTGLSNFVFHGMPADAVARIGHLPVGEGLLGALIDDPRPIRLEDLQDDQRSSGFPPHHPEMRSFLGVPIVSRGKVFGNLYLTEKEGGGAFTAEDERLAIVLAGQASVAVENARLYEEARENEATARRRLEELSEVQEVAAAVLRVLDPERVLEMIAERARGLVGAKTALIAMARADSFVIDVAAGSRAADLRGREIPISDSLSGRTLRTGESALINDVRSDPRVHAPIATAAGARSVIFVPLLDRQDALGVLAVTHDAPGRFDGEDVFVLRSFAHLASLALRNARLLTEEKARARAEAALDAAEARDEMREQLLREVIRAQEEERRRVARELHDSAGQALASILLGLKVVDQQKNLTDARAKLTDLREVTAAATRELRRISLELRPSLLDDLGLPAALARHAEDVAERTGLDFDVEITLDGRLDPEVETVFFRVAQEALTNVAKYAEARSVLVELSKDDGIVRLVVRDDGKGFRPAEAALRGLGLRGMRERTDLVGGKLEIVSGPGAGTTVTLETAGEVER